MCKLIDFSASGEGYLNSPLDGTLASVVAKIARLESESEVSVERRLGVSVEFALHARSLGAEFDWGSPWIELAESGYRTTLPAKAMDSELVRQFRALGMAHLCVGRSCTLEAISDLVTWADAVGMGVAAIPNAAWVELLDRSPNEQGDSQRADANFESLAGLLSAVHSYLAGVPDAASDGQRLMLLAELPEQDLDRVLGWIVERRLSLTPLLLATWRKASLVNLVNAPFLTDAAEALPYHRRIASLRAPGAIRLGGREASKHLGIPMVNHAGQKQITAGFSRLQAALVTLVAQGQPIRGGSGAPGAGLAPGRAVREEFELWCSLGIAQSSVEAAFGEAATALSGGGSAR